ncbi:FMN-dependent NADH-azoreductase 1 [Phascolomyces articulosus]|uniref:FMN-dependent NADH-azoreductase n=1 Tax=Phascolomyces articulosus TaxID=60185 RepID=A0AAD5JXJ0_9FUNG|nr:FMN-dependent NADH-azoreductase 1 [Phascolomyces articulosus]
MSFMKKTLIINAHPKIDDTASFSIRVMNEFLAHYRQAIPSDHIIEQLNLYQDDIPTVDRTVLSAWDKQAHNKKSIEQIELTDQEKKVTDRIQHLVDQFKSAGTYVIVMPLHNFNIPSKLKDYMDDILIAGETFYYAKGGRGIGLLNEQKRQCLLIQGSGAVYTNNDWYTQVEFSYKYLHAMFQFMGIEDFEIVRAQGTARTEGKEERLILAYQQVEQQAHRLASSL